MNREHTALTQLEKWILDYEKVNGTPTMCEIKAQLEMFKQIEKEQITYSYIEGGRKGFNVFGEDYEQYYDETYTQNSE